jgi:hypothetical protein
MEVSAMRRYTVICEWEGDSAMDADQLTVSADSEESAIKKAKSRWQSEFGSRWPDCRLGEVFILPPKRSAETS